MANEVATISPPRIAFPALVEERFGIDRSSWKALTEAIWPSAKTADAVVLALSYCKARNLDPFKKVVHIVPVWSKEKGGMIETVWPGIAEHRTTAVRTREYGGCDEAEFGPEVETQFQGCKLKHPLWARMTIYRLAGSQRLPCPGPKVYFLETYSTVKRDSDTPNDRWKRSPYGMLEKCAEAAALRRAFPEEVGGSESADEVDSAIGPEKAIDVTPPRPTRVREDAVQRIAAEEKRRAEDPERLERQLAEAETVVSPETHAVVKGDRFHGTDDDHGTTEAESSQAQPYVVVAPDGQVLEYEVYEDFVKGLYAEMESAKKGSVADVTGWHESQKLDQLKPEHRELFDKAFAAYIARRQRPAAGEERLA